MPTLNDLDEFKAVVADLLRQQTNYAAQYEQHPIIRREAELYEKGQHDAELAAQAIAGWIGLNPSDHERTQFILNSTLLLPPSSISADVRLEVGQEYAAYWPDPTRLTT